MTHSVSPAMAEIDLEAGVEPGTIVQPPSRPWATRSYSLCGRCQIGCMEIPMVIGECVAFVGAVYYSYVEVTTAAVTAGVPGVACLIAHYLVRKYGNESLLIEEQAQNASDLRASLAVQIAKVNALAKDLRSAQETNAKASEQIARFETGNVEFAKQVAIAMAAAQQFQSENEVLQKTVAGLQGDVQQLTKSKSEIAQWTADYAEQNSALKKDLDQLVAAIPSLQGLQVSLAGGKLFDAALQEFAQKIQESRILSDQIIQSMQAQNNGLISEMEQLRKDYAQMVEVEGKTRADLELVQKMLQDQEVQTKALQAIETAISQHRQSPEVSALITVLNTLKTRLDALEQKRSHP